MYRIYGPKFWITAVGYVVLGINLLLGTLNTYWPQIGLHPSFGLIIFGAQLAIGLVFMTPLWRCVWRLVPKFNEWVFPDVSGEWDVEVASNWPRIDRLLKSASGKAERVDYRICEAEDLAPLAHLKMRARITQSWSSIRILLWNPNQDTPIEDSETLLVEPIRGLEGGRSSLNYMFKQRNKTDVISDDCMFYGAAQLEIQPGFQEMRGTMWSNRMWRRGLNTAASLHFTRRA